jgi:uncharacterized membrane protein (TIGR02234 family)
MFGGLVLLAAGALTVVRGRHWPGMSSRYETPAARASRETASVREQSTTPKGLWDALDRGEDPTTPSADSGEHRTPTSEH